MEKELLSLPEHLSSPQFVFFCFFVGSCRSIPGFRIVFSRSLFVLLFFSRFGHCIVRLFFDLRILITRLILFLFWTLHCLSSIYGFCLPLGIFKYFLNYQRNHSTKTISAVWCIALTVDILAYIT